MPFDISELHRQAREAAAKTAAILLGGANKTVNFRSAHDVKLQADVDSEKLVRSELAASGLPVIGEELGGDAALFEGDALYWVVDPLDGTYNYLRDQPATCVSIGLMRGREPLCGVIHDFCGGRVYEGVVGRGVTINGVPVTPQWAENLAQACLMTGFPAAANKSAEALAVFVRRVGQFKKVRMIGSAALATAYVGMGLADVYLENGTNLWDVAAGLALVKAAGGDYVLTPMAGAGAEVALRFDVVAAGKKEWLAV
jgi:myo-inositol-1(or 4)-monophosphatase